MPVPICPRKDSEQGLILRWIKCQTAPSSHVRKINSRLGIFYNFAVTILRIVLETWRDLNFSERPSTNADVKNTRGVNDNTIIWSVRREMEQTLPERVQKKTRLGGKRLSTENWANYKILNLQTNSICTDLKMMWHLAFDGISWKNWEENNKAKSENGLDTLSFERPVYLSESVKSA